MSDEADQNAVLSGNMADRWLDETDSLKLYYQQLCENAPISAESELQLWQKIEDEICRIRETIYSFGFILTEHIKLIREGTPDSLLDLFLLSAVPEKMRDDGKPLQRVLTGWSVELSALTERMQSAYQGGKKRLLDQCRKEAQTLLKKYPVNQEKLREWYEVALQFQTDMNRIMSEESPGEEEKKHIDSILKKVMMTGDQFNAAMDELAPVAEKIQKFRHEILSANLRLVVSIVNRFGHHNIQTVDLIQEGNLGLIHAMEKFDFRLGHKFATYATWWIKQSISRAIASQARVIRLPSHMLFSISRIHRAEQAFLQNHGRDPSDEELAEILQVTRERVRSIKLMAAQPISLQAPLGNSDDFSLENLLSDSESTDPERQLASKMLRRSLEKALDTLSEREQQIIRMRFGLDGETPKTLIELSKMFRLTRERVRQLEWRAIQKLRAPELIACFQDYLK